MKLSAGPKGLKLSLDRREAVGGVTRALGIMSLWSCLLVVDLSLPWAGVSWFYAPLFVAAQTLLYTGLFITAHDAMHGIIHPTNRKLNDLIGALAVMLYAMFSYKLLHQEHHKHHAHVGSGQDPDYDTHQPQRFWRWYGKFLTHYVSFKQIVLMAIVYNLLAHLVGVDQERLLVFWVLPSLLSTVQLFYFGTYLPHRGAGFEDEHRSRSNDLSEWLSLLSCYHFGYHWEHHAYPYCPWWRLPMLRRALNTADEQTNSPQVTLEQTPS